MELRGYKLKQLHIQVEKKKSKHQIEIDRGGTSFFFLRGDQGAIRKIIEKYQHPKIGPCLRIHTFNILYQFSIFLTNFSVNEPWRNQSFFLRKGG